MTWNYFHKKMCRFYGSAANECERRGVKMPAFTMEDVGDYYHVHGVKATGRGFARFMINRTEQRKKNKNNKEHARKRKRPS